MKKVLISVMAIALVAALVGVGTFAWFSDTETSAANTFTAGTLNMKIADNNEGWNDGLPVTASWVSPAGLLPGDTFDTGLIRLQNVGSADIPYLFTNYYGYDYVGADLGSAIEVVEYWEDIPGYGPVQNIGGLQQLELSIGDGVAPLTLRELVEGYWPGDTTPDVDYCTGSGYDTTPGPAIIKGGTYSTYLKLHFMETAGNEFQGASCSFSVAFEGVQDNAAQKH